MFECFLFKKNILKNLSTLNQFIIYFLICIFPAGGIFLLQFYPFILTENSILYLHATSAQVISALIALSLVAYTYLNSELNQKVLIDISLDDAIFLTKKNAFKDLTITILVGILSIFSSLLVLVSFNYIAVQDISMTVSFLSLVIFTFALIKFIHRSFSLEAIQKNNAKVLEESKKELEEFLPDSFKDVDDLQDSEENSRLREVPLDSLEASLGKFFIAFEAGTKNAAPDGRGYFRA